jgi:hypothetical protein
MSFIMNQSIHEQDEEESMIQIEQENPYKLPATFHVAVEFPASIFFHGIEYSRTGKYGINRTTGIPSAEYGRRRAGLDLRVWMDANENITREP